MPLDEDVTPRPAVAYALGKHLEEEMATQFCRWDPTMKMIGLRFSNVMDDADYAEFPTFDSDPASRRWNLWSYIDARHGAAAVVLALDYDAVGFSCFNANADSVMSAPSEHLLDQFFPGTASCISIEKARQELGFDPTHSWWNTTVAE